MERGAPQLELQFSFQPTIEFGENKNVNRVKNFVKNEVLLN